MAWGNQGPFGSLFARIGALHKSSFPICELLITLATFLAWGNHEPFGGLFFRIWGPRKKAPSQCVCELLIHKTGHFLAWGDQEPFGGLFSGCGALQKNGFPLCMYIGELLIKLATFWLGKTRGLLEAFLGKGTFKKAGSQRICTPV